MRTYIGPVIFALLVMIVGLYFFIDEAKPTSGPHKAEDVAIDSDAKKHFSLIAEKYASEASETSGVSKN
ncbi:hypothetical protein FD977_02485 [Polynucleobacter sp. AP-Elch-400A-B2]|uniref:hypothetical protein n=1 Tax=Polynucleobacter sp. AP-Elch-400A-B2 TaxID=2576930 RepID=UPI001BFECC85|nr:hypothetical protein [Polynucleobacter sp. AP-Elch-400A-B2]QWE25148.1 hypothetical protein FD977_02485 [Polynucleobacter sp. AP-Elch-400A-B2]